MNEPEPVKAPIPRSPRFETLDLLRGVACVMIVLLHSTMVQISAGRESSRSIFSLVLLAHPMASPTFRHPGYCILQARCLQEGKVWGTTTLCVESAIYPPYLIALCFTILFMGLVAWFSGYQVAYLRRSCPRSHTHLEPVAGT